MNIYGVRGFPTPDFTDERHCRTFSIPNTTIALAVFMGALWQLADEKNWQQYGDMTPAEAAEQFQDMIWDAYANDYGICPNVPAPYWDDLTADDADDTLPASEQIWYGELVALPAARRAGDDDLTFIENLRIWIVAGAFLVLTRNVGATIAFVPIAKRFTLAFRKHDLGGIVRVFIDAAEVGRVDTYAETPSVGDFDVWLPDDDDEHDLWVSMAEEHNPAVDGQPEIQVIRKRLSPDDVSPENLRYNSDCDCVQQTYDGGSTWVDQPGQDPRHSTIYQLPPVTADDPRCQAAANMTRYFEDLIGDTLGFISTGLDGLGVATAAIMPALGELGPYAILIDLGIGLASGLIGLGVDVITSEFSPETYDALECIFFCHLQPDGTATAESVSSILADIGANLNPDVYLIMGLCFLLMGEVGLTNAGTIGEAPADCDECNCLFCYEWDFTISSYTVDGWDAIAPYGQYAAGQGWESTADGLIMSLLFPSAVEIQSVNWGGTSFSGIGPYGRATFYRLGGSTIFTDNQSGISNPYTIDTEHTDTVDQLWLNPYAGVGADVYIQKCKIACSVEVPEWAARLVIC